MKILGVNAFHGDSSAALLVDGRLVAAVEEERFLRVKHWAGWPQASIRCCMELGGLAAHDLDAIAVSFDPGAHPWRKVRHVLRHLPTPSAILGRLQRQAKTFSLREIAASSLGCHPSNLRAKIHRVEHHAAHLDCAFLQSPYPEAALLSVDGMGDFVSTVLACGGSSGVRRLTTVFAPHSLGLLYNAVTLFLGFPAYGDEYKVMGLAPYGKPEFLPLMRRLIRPTPTGFELGLEFFRHHREGISMRWDGGAPSVAPFHSALLEKELGPPREARAEVTDRERNLAASLQVVTEEIVFHLLDLLAKQTPADCLCVSGGVAMNSVAVGKITANSRFREVYVPPGAADNGTATGAALHVWAQEAGYGRPRVVCRHALWGPEFGDEEIDRAISEAGLKAERYARGALEGEVVARLLAGEVVGWFQGRMEFGARALGNRSLLADPRRVDMRDIINSKIKFREMFRPFAPSVLREHVGEWFERDEPSPFMERVLVIRPEKRPLIPAVTHVDGTGRLQTVERETSPLYWALIEEFRRQTGVPMLLNTSLNENEPIVHTPREALACFSRTSMDAIALGSYLVSREPRSHKP